MAVYPSNSSKYVTKSIVICCHFLFGSGIGYNAPAFFLWSDFTSWQTGQDRTYSPTVPHIRGGQNFPKSTEIRNSVAFRAFFPGFFRPFLSVVAESVSEQLLQRIGGLGGQFWLSKESVSTSATDCQILTPIWTKYGFQNVRTCKIDRLYR